jgi:N utilization substance protein A
MIGRAIVLVKEDQLSLAIGRRGQNVRLASKLCGWDIEIMTADELDEQIERAVAGFGELEGMTDELAQALVEQGYLSYDDLSVIEPDAMKEMGDLTDEQVTLIIDQAEEKAEEAERAAVEERRRQKEQEALARAQQREAEKMAEATAAASGGEEIAATDTQTADEQPPAEQESSPDQEVQGDTEATPQATVADETNIETLEDGTTTEASAPDVSDEQKAPEDDSDVA